MNLPKSHKILFITSGQPSLNPRLVKEADTLADSGYEVTVLYAYWNEWGTKFDEELIPSKKWKAIRVGGDPKQKPFTWFLSRLILKTANYIIQKTGRYKYFGDWAISRSSYFLMKEAKKHSADLYIAHNLGALPAAVQTALRYKKPCGFDAEDFHRQEIVDDINSFHFKICSYLEDKYLPLLNYMSASSPLIAGCYASLYKFEVTSLLNVFPATSVPDAIDNEENKFLKLFWFSQTIGPNRGLEDIIEALQFLKDYSFELHLLGEGDADIKNIFTTCLKGKSSTIHFHEPIPSDKIIEFAAQFDIGLALETETPFNRDICLTNKIFTYIQAGLAVIASNTTAQAELLQQYPTIGKLYEKKNIRSLADLLLYYMQNRSELFETREAALMIADKELNWENESRKFLNIITDVLTASPQK
jgi:glycosyltransferase involved in cell wall biosynthesis